MRRMKIIVVLYNDNFLQNELIVSYNYKVTVDALIARQIKTTYGAGFLL